MKKSYSFRNKTLITIGIATSLLSTQLFAKCEPSVAKDYPGEVPANYFGNSQTDSFRCAITGATELSADQLREQDDLIPPKLTDRWYVLVGANAAAEGIARATNNSIYDTVAQAGVLSSTQVKTASNNAQLAFGYAWTDWAVDVMWLSSKSVTFNASLQQISPVIPFSSNVSGDALLLDVYWIFVNRYNFNLYGLLAAGLSYNRTTTNIDNGSATVCKRYSPAYGLGVGGRFNLVSKLFADMNARYMLLGRNTMQASNSAGRFIIIKSYRTWAGLTASLMWMF